MSDTVHRRAVFGLPLLLVFFGVAVQAQPAFLVEDLNTTRSRGIDSELGFNYYRDNFVALGETVFFGASDGIHGSELWRTDGTEAGTRLVADICPGSCASTPRSLATVGNLVFFVADDGIHGTELWKSDGTAAGTVLVRDLIPEDQYAWIDGLTEVDGLLLFSFTVYGQRQELWRSDGTAAGTFLLVDFMETREDVRFEPLAHLGSKLFFTARDNSGLRKPWITDGTAAGTFRLKDIAAGFSMSAAVARGKVFFDAEGPEGWELWASDGTAAGTGLVKDINPGVGDSFPQGLNALGEEVFFFASGALWRSDGTASGTLPVKSVSDVHWLATAGGRLFFSSDCDLWTSDGTEAGTVLVKEFDGPCYQGKIAPWDDGGGELLFTADHGLHGREPWRSDGTPAGTALLADLNPGAASSSPGLGTFVEGRWYFLATGGDDVGFQLWTSDGTAAGTRMLQINHQRSGLQVNARGELLGPRAFFDLGGTLLFQGGDGPTGAELWRSDGTAAGTSLVKDLQPGPASSLPGEFTRAGDTVFFRSDAGSSNEKLWRTDGTPEGTLLLREALQFHNFGFFSPRDLTALGNDLLFLGSSYIDSGPELMKSDGTPEGTMPVGPPGSLYAESMVSLGGLVLFQATYDYDDLWKSDGTAAGTARLGTVLPSGRLLSQSSSVRDGVLLFAGFAPETGEELWRSDGTAAGTYLLAETVPGPDSKRLGPFAVAGPNLFFAAGGNELWKNDAAGTGLVRALPGDPAGGIRSLTPLGEKVYFAYDDGVHGRELWVSDGTEAGTRMVEDLLPGPGSSHPRQLHAEGAILLFSASDGVHGLEPWRSDGTALGTRMLQDIAPGALPSSPAEFTASGPNVYFTANDGMTGFELWALPRPALLATFADVPADHWAWRFVEALAASGLTGGCATDSFCPALQVTRAEAAVFLVRAAHGPAFVPPPATGTIFQDIPAGHWAGPWIEQLAAEGVTAGCGGGNFCPGAPLTRAEVAVLLLRARYGSGFVPPPATGTVFNDVPEDHWAASWIERLAAEGVTTGCGGGSYCPARTVTRAEVAVFLVRMFGLPLP
ncbi:MAG TPA: ELWxxDGT repeat protein [Thermoanaerobaculia bacterium]|jgi:ELWxxDGT repeat protein